MRIKEYKLSLMKREENVPEEEDRENFIVRSSATLDIEKACEEGYDEEFIYESCSMIYEDLLKNTNDDVDSLGLWITYEDDSRVESSMKLSTLDVMGSNREIDPVQEFFKMTM